MTDQSWTRLTGNTQNSMIKSINALHHADFFDAESTRLQEKAVPFYADFKLMEATEFASHPPLTMRFFRKDDQVFKLDGSRKAIYDINEKAKLVLNKKTVIDYVKFFLGALMTEEGSFRVVETMEDIVFSDEPDDKTINDIKENLFEVSVYLDGDVYEVTVCMLFGENMHEATINVTGDGQLDIIDEDTLLTNLPTREIFLK